MSDSLIPFGAKSARNSVFLWAAGFSFPYGNYHEMPEIKEELAFEVQVAMRYDRTVGTIGGKVDDADLVIKDGVENFSETLKKAVRREALEESNQIVDGIRLGNLATFVQSDFPDHHIHSFYIYETHAANVFMKNCLETGHFASHFQGELTGFIRLRMTMDELFNLPAPQLARMEFAGSGFSEFALLLNNFKLGRFSMSGESPKLSDAVAAYWLSYYFYEWNPQAKAGEAYLLAANLLKMHQNGYASFLFEMFPEGWHDIDSLSGVISQIGCDGDHPQMAARLINYARHCKQTQEASQ